MHYNGMHYTEVKLCTYTSMCTYTCVMEECNFSHFCRNVSAGGM